MARDTLFREYSYTEGFQFDERVAEVFDDMLQRSVPCYAMVIDMIGAILGRFLRPGDLVLDLGCSTGTTLLSLARLLPDKKFLYRGMDNSSAMVAKARLKAEMYSKKDVVEFLEEDIIEAELGEAGAVIVNYTLQFIHPSLRSGFLGKAYRALRPGGILILSEKVVSRDAGFSGAFLDFYFDFKRRRGYSEIEISRKREALEKILLPLSMEENRRLLEEAGFAGVESFFQWFNFVSFLAVK